jgi:peptidyl-prolyl cis-trans isomerase B (cyclophilin B)
MSTTTFRVPAIAASLLTFALAGVASAQLTPDRLYYGVGRDVPMTVKVPEGKKGEVSVQLLEAGTAKQLATAGAAAGSVNLATLFPQIWTAEKPAVVYAQLVVGEEKVGPAVVIQPLTAPIMARPGGPRGEIQFVESPRAVLSGVRTYVDKNVVVETTEGSLTIQLRPDVAPNTAWSFRSLVEGGFYTDISIHRIAKNNGQGFPFVVQAGDPNGNGQGGPGFNIDLEKTTALPHDFGVVSMARTNDPNTAGSQFFICLSREGTSFLDGKYATFGQTIAGPETITKLQESPTQPGTDKPVNPPKIKSAKLEDAAPYGTGPKPVTKPAAEGSGGR